MSRWEYAELNFHAGAFSTSPSYYSWTVLGSSGSYERVDNRSDHIAAMGAEGWDLVGFDAVHGWIFKRQLTDG
jgi:hypothetical protein